MKPGIYDIKNHEYHSCEGISRSAISEFKKSPLHYWYNYLNPEKPKKEETKSMRIGSAVHCLVLEPAIFDDEFIVSRKFGRKKKDKEDKAQFEIINAGKILLSEDEYRDAKEIAISIIEHPHTEKFLSGSFSVEKSIFWIDEESEILCKARPDIWQKDIEVICDIKTTNDASLDSFTYSVRKSNYHIQAAMQIDAIFATTGSKVETFCILAAPNEKPYKPYIYVLDENVIELGRKEYKNALKLLKKCTETNKWDLEREQPLNVLHHLEKPLLHTLMEIYECQQN